MGLIALLLALAAILVFLIELARPGRNLTPLGLALFVAAVIAQAVQVTGWHWMIR